ncbi:MAG: hydrogenase maturation protease [Anaerolineales bacterium]|jgi:hydrogenase maturation protease
MTTLLLGLGNPLLRDDSVGLKVAQLLQPLLVDQPDVTVDVDYWGGLRLMERMIGYDHAIIVDAIITGAQPGTVHVLAPDDMPTQRSMSAHDVNLSTALAVGREAGANLPSDEHIMLIGVEAADVQTFDEELSTEVKAALPEAMEIALSALKEIKGRDER